MLLGVDRSEDLSIEPIGGQRIAAVIVGLGVLALPLLALWSTDGEATGARAAEGSLNAISGEANDITSLGRSLFTDYLFARSEEHTSELQSLMRISYSVF